MKLSAGLALAAMFLTSQGSSMTYYELTARGGSRIYSLDAPVRKGRQLLFHRYPDGVYMSLSAAEVEKISPLEVAPPPFDGTRISAEISRGLFHGVPGVRRSALAMS